MEKRIKIIKEEVDDVLERLVNEFCEDKEIIDITLHRGSMTGDKILIVYKENEK